MWYDIKNNEKGVICSMSNISEVKGKMAPIVRFMIKEHQVSAEELQREIENKIGSHANFFSEAILCIDFSEVSDIHLYETAKKAFEIFESLGIDVVLYECTENQHSIMKTVAKNKKRITTSGKSTNVEAKPEQTANTVSKPSIKEEDIPSGNMIVNKHIRSGQRIVAEGKNLIIYGNVSNGAEVMADGSITIFGSLRGKAFAGLRGDSGSIIFAQKMNPEIISISGIFIIKEDVEEKYQNIIDKPAFFTMDSGEQIEFKEMS